MIDDSTPMPFGKKHHGTLMRDVPNEYLHWMQANCDGLHDDMKEYIQQRLSDSGDTMTEEEVNESRGMSSRNKSECKSCGAEIVWVKVDDKNIPLDTRELKVWVRGAKVWKLVTGFETHFSTCPNSDQHRGTAKDSTEPSDEHDPGDPFSEGGREPEEEQQQPEKKKSKAPF